MKLNNEFINKKICSFSYQDCGSIHVSVSRCKQLTPCGGKFSFFWGPSALIWIFLVQSSVFKNKAMRYLILYGVLSLGLLQYTLWKHMSDWDRLSLLNEFYGIFVFFSCNRNTCR